MTQYLLNWIKEKRFHLIAWMSFILYETVLLGVLFGVFWNPITYFLHYLVTIILFYIYTDWGLEWVFKRKYYSWLKLSIVIGLWCILYLLLHFIVEYILTISGIIKTQPDYTILKDYISRNIYRGTYFLGLGTGYFYIKTYLYEKKKSAELEKQHLEDIIQKQQIEQELTQAQNAFLKAQINPHFLFNTLDFVYHEVNASSPKAGETIISLSNMMRYALDAEQQGEQVRLMDEINQLEDLIRIYRLRNEQLQLELVYDQEVTHLRIIPLVLLTLAENMFKHGLLNQSDNPARIQIELIDDQLQINTRNLVGRSGGSSHQQGLENIRKRLEQAYGSDSCLTYGASNGMFELRLSIAVERMR